MSHINRRGFLAGLAAIPFLPLSSQRHPVPVSGGFSIPEECRDSVLRLPSTIVTSSTPHPRPLFGPPLPLPADIDILSRESFKRAWDKANGL